MTHSDIHTHTHHMYPLQKINTHKIEISQVLCLSYSSIIRQSYQLLNVIHKRWDVNTSYEQKLFISGLHIHLDSTSSCVLPQAALPYATSVTLHTSMLLYKFTRHLSQRKTTGRIITIHFTQGLVYLYFNILSVYSISYRTVTVLGNAIQKKEKAKTVQIKQLLQYTIARPPSIIMLNCEMCLCVG